MICIILSFHRNYNIVMRILRSNEIKNARSLKSMSPTDTDKLMNQGKKLENP